MKGQKGRIGAQQPALGRAAVASRRAHDTTPPPVLVLPGWYQGSRARHGQYYYY
jgi:hypothetical protein